MSCYIIETPALRIGVEILFWGVSQKRLKQKPDRAFLLGSAQKNYFINGMLKGYFGGCPLFALMAFTIGNMNAITAMAIIPRMPNPSSKTKGTQRIK